MSAGHGPNIGHGFVKYVVIDQTGKELPPVIFPAQISRAGHVSGALYKVATVYVNGQQWWTGDDATLAGQIETKLSQERLHDQTFIPALLQGALARLGYLNGSSSGACVTGLPATWAQDAVKAKQLGALLKAGYPNFTRVKVIAEPLGLIYSQLLDNNGDIAGDPMLLQGRIAVVDIGHLTVDTAIINKMFPEPDGLNTFHLGTSGPLGKIRASLSSYFDRDLSMVEVDQAVRNGVLRVAGHHERLSDGWDAPLVANGRAIADRLTDIWSSGRQFDAILIGGGGAELPALRTAIEARFRHARAVADPQIAIARGYARLARRIGGPQ